MVFDVNADSPRRELAARPIYFCCEGCAGYFDTQPDRVRTLRRLDGGR